MGNIFSRSPTIEQLHEQFAIAYVDAICNQDTYDVPIINKAHHLLLFISQHKQEEYFDNTQTMQVETTECTYVHKAEFYYRRLYDTHFIRDANSNPYLSLLYDIAKKHNNEICRPHMLHSSACRIDINFDCRDLNCIIRDTAKKKIEWLQQTLPIHENDCKQMTEDKLKRDIHMENVKNEIAILNTEMQQNNDKAKNADKQTKLLLVSDNATKHAKIELLKAEQKEYASFCGCFDEKKRNVDTCEKEIVKLTQLVECLDCADEQNNPCSIDEKMDTVVEKSDSKVTVIKPKDI
jgi:hypothetical protein